MPLKILGSFNFHWLALHIIRNYGKCHVELDENSNKPGKSPRRLSHWINGVDKGVEKSSDGVCLEEEPCSGGSRVRRDVE